MAKMFIKIPLYEHTCSRRDITLHKIINSDIEISFLHFFCMLPSGKRCVSHHDILMVFPSMQTQPYV